MADALCRNNRGRRGCQEIVTDGGVKDSGFCEKCWYPTIVEDHARYEALLKEGYSRTQAAQLSGLADPHEVVENRPAHRVGTAPIAAITQDENDESEALQDALTDKILNRIDEDNASE